MAEKKSTKKTETTKRTSSDKSGKGSKTVRSGKTTASARSSKKKDEGINIKARAKYDESEFNFIDVTPSDETGTTKRKKPKSSKEAEAQIVIEKAMEMKKKKLIHDEILAVVIILLGIFFFLSLFTASAGTIGRVVGACLYGLFGKLCAYFIPVFMILFGILIFARRASLVTIRSGISILVLFVAISTLLGAGYAKGLGSIDFETVKGIYAMSDEGPGVIGAFIGFWLLKFTGKVGVLIISIACIIISLVFIANTPISVFFDNLKLKRIARREARIQRQAEVEAQIAEEAERAQAEVSELGDKAIADANANRKTMPEPTDGNSFAKAMESFDARNKIEQMETPEGPVFNGQVPDDELKRVQRTDAENDVKFENKLDLSSIHDTDAKLDAVYTENQKKILELVKDDELFACDRSGSGSYGLNATLTMPDDFSAAINDAPDADADMQAFDAFEKTLKEKTTAAELGRNGAASSKTDQTAARTRTGSKGAAQATALETEAISAEIAQKKTLPYSFPPISLLSKPIPGRGGRSSDLAAQAKILEDSLHSFGVSAKVVNYVKGPAVTRFEVQPAAGVKVSSIVHLHDDIALNLRAKSLRIEAPIPGKAAIGIEVSNDSINMVTLREVLESKDFKDAKSKISVGLGKSIAGDAVVANLKDMPHLLVAGATGAGKSVCINSLILSLLYKASPQEVKLILIDPKVVELSEYNGIPHLLIPVVTDPPKAISALNWAVAEMNDRYKKFSEAEVRELQSYNDLARMNGEEEKVMPQIVIIIDELNDLMMSAQNAVEDAITRLTQKARAAGMHLILATQRPSVDVITGVIKANIPSRIAFKVSSGTDSRVILNEIGAENLLGKGDMLFFPQGEPKPTRVQGCYVSDKEISDVLDYVKKHSGDETYSSDVMNAVDKGSSPSDAASAGDSVDELFDEAVVHVISSEKCSTSMLQRRFAIGYNRAARLVDIMEEMGIVSAADGQKPRKVLISLDQWDSMREGKNPMDVDEEIF